MNGKLLISAVSIIAVIALILILSPRQSNNSNTNLPTQTQTAQNQVSSPPMAITSESIVTVTNDGFNPKKLTIGVDATVTWINKSGELITIDSDPHPTHTAYLPLNLGEVNDGKSVFLIFDKPGTYGYHNHLKPSQKGTIIVQ